MSRSPVARSGRLLPLLALLLTAAPVSAQTDYYWNAPTGGTGTWDTATQNWATAVDGPVNYTWLNNGNERANFGNTAGTVTLGTGITANGLNFTTSGYTIAGNTLTLAGTGEINTGSFNATLDSTIGGSATLTKTGTGTLTFTGTWTGALTVNEGVFAFGSTLDLGSTASGQVTINGGTLKSNNTGAGGSFISANRPIAIGANGGTVETSGTLANSSVLYRGTITGSGNTLTKNGSGEFRYEGAGTANSTYTRLVVNQGLFRIGNGVAGSTEVGFGAVPGAPLADAITLNGGGIGSSLGLTLNANRGITLGAGGGTINVSAAALTIPSVITGGGDLAVVGDAETDVLTLSGANNYTGATTITTSRLTTNAANTLPSNTAVTVGAGATLNLNSNSQIIGSLAGAGGVSLGTGTLTTGGNNTSTTYSGVMSGFSGSLVKQGTGTMILTGNNTFGGGGSVTIDGGTLLANGQSGTNSGTGAGPVAVNSGGTFGGTGRAAGSVTVNGDGRVLGGDGTAAGQTLSLGENLTIDNNGGIRVAAAIGSGFNDISTNGASLVVVEDIFGRTATSDIIQIDIELVGGGFDLEGNTTYTRRILTYGGLSNLDPGSWAFGDGRFNVNAVNFTLGGGWQVDVGQDGAVIDVSFTPVPEPGTVLAVAACGLGVAGLVRRRLRRDLTLAA
jgi:autotransporter-associated beta strand protein